MKKILILIALVLLVGCSSGANITSEVTGNAVAYDEPSDVKVVVKLQGNVIDPSEITVKQGSLVVLDIVDLDNTTDVFVIEGYNLEQRVEDGKAIFYFEADRKGQFSYGLRTDKRKGTLVVN